MEELNDRIGKFLIPYLEENFIFDELKDDFLRDSGFADIISGVPVPIKQSDFAGLTNVRIAQNMAFVIGCDINFKYRDNYIEYIERNFEDEFVKVLIAEGGKAGEDENFLKACVYFRAALLMDPENKDAWYCYGRACLDAYSSEEEPDEDFTGRFKAESLRAFERLTIVSPEFDMGYYFLGYGYLNMGLYAKASLTWEEFMNITEDGDMKLEISEWMEKLKDPVKIEEGCNYIISGQFPEGLNILEPYSFDERFNVWWPLWFYLGIAYKGLEMDPVAEAALKRCLQFSPSNIDAMQLLVEIYEEMGDVENMNKYINKIRLIQSMENEE